MYKISGIDNVLEFLKEQSGEPTITTQQSQVHATFECGCKIVSDKKGDWIFPCDKHKSEMIHLNIPKGVNVDDYLYHGFKSSLDEFPPYMTPIKMIDSMGVKREVVLHENENDGYNFNEKPLRIHLLMKQTESFRWKLLCNSN